MQTNQLTHINSSGEAHMVDVSEKEITTRTARAEAIVSMSAETLRIVMEGDHHKGDVFATARIAGIMAAKKTAELIPLCHPLLLSKIDIQFELDATIGKVLIRALCKVEGSTGVEMEALTAVSVCALTIYDMCKSADKNIVISEIKLLEKLKLKKVVDIYYMDFPLPITRIKKIYVQNVLIKNHIMINMDTSEKGFLSDRLFDVFQDNKAIFFDQKSLIELKDDAKENDYSIKMRIFDKKLGMFSFMKNTNIYYTNDTGIISNYSDNFLSTLASSCAIAWDAVLRNIPRKLEAGM